MLKLLIIITMCLFGVLHSSSSANNLTQTRSQIKPKTTEEFNKLITASDNSDDLFCCLDETCEIKSSCSERISPLGVLYRQDDLIRKIPKAKDLRKLVKNPVCATISYVQSDKPKILSGCAPPEIVDVCKHMTKFNASEEYSNLKVRCNICYRNLCNKPDNRVCCTDEFCFNSAKCAVSEDVITHEKYTMLLRSECISYIDDRYKAKVFGCVPKRFYGQDPCKIITERGLGGNCKTCDTDKCNGSPLTMLPHDTWRTPSSRRCYIDQRHEVSVPCKSFSSLHTFANDELLSLNQDLYDEMTSDMEQANCISILYTDSTFSPKMLRGCTPDMLLGKKPCDSIFDLGKPALCFVCNTDNCNTIAFPQFESAGLRKSPIDVPATASKKDSYDFLVSIAHKAAQGSPTHFCTGTLIKARWVLTAAHCLHYKQKATPIPESEMFVIAKSDTINDGRGVTISVDRTMTFDTYDPLAPSSQGDVGLVKLKTSVTGLTVPNFGVYAAGSIAPVFAPGWGINRFEVSPTNAAMTVSTGWTIPYELCANLMGNVVDISSFVCVLQVVKGSVCKGGPILNMNNEILGIASLHADCGGSYPVLYSKLSRYQTWINEITV